MPPADDSRVRRRGGVLEEVMPEPSYRPIETESSGIVNLLRPIAPLVLVACIAVSFFPEVFRMLPEPWRISPVVLRTVAILAFIALLVRNAKTLANRNQERKKAISDFANTVRGQFSDTRYRPTAGGWEGGPRVEYSVSGRAVVLTLDRVGSSSLSCRISAELPVTRDFQFQLLPGGKAMRFILSKTFMVPVLQLAVKGAGTAATSPAAREAAAKAGIDLSSRESIQKHLADRLGYLASDPITIGEEAFDREFLVKASDPTLGRGLASDPSVRSALKALRERSSSFQVGLESPGTGPSRLVAGISAFDFSPATLAAMDAMVRAMLEALSRLDLIERGGRGAA
jgi:hypothetical protein